MTGPGAGSLLGADPNDPAAAQVRVLGTRMLRGGFWPALAVAVLAVVVAGVLAGTGGLVAAGIAAVVTLVVSTVTPLLVRTVAPTEGTLLLAVTFVGFTTKLGALVVLLVVVRTTEALDVAPFALALAAVAVAFIVGQIVAFRRTPMPSVESGPKTGAAADPAS